MGRSQEGKVRVSLFPPQGGQSKGTRDGTGRRRQPRAQPGIAAFPGGSEGLGGPGTPGKPSPEPLEPPQPQAAQVCHSLQEKGFIWLALAVLPLPVPSREEEGEEEPFLPPPLPGKQPRIPQPQVPVLPLPALLPAGAGRAGAPFLIYSTPLEHALDPNGAPGTAARGAPGTEQGLQGQHMEFQAGTRGSRLAHNSRAGRRRQPRGMSSLLLRWLPGWEGTATALTPAPGKRAEPRSCARKIRKESWKTQEKRVSGRRGWMDAKLENITRSVGSRP